MRTASASRRRWLAGATSTALATSALLAMGSSTAGSQPRSTATGGSAGGDAGATLTLHTFGDSILDCGHYNERGLHPGRLLVQNDDALFPEFRHRDLRSRGSAQLEHHAVDGSTVDGLAEQLRRVRTTADSIAIVTVGGNDLLRGLAGDDGRGMRDFEAKLERFLGALAVRPVVIGTVYDPTFGDDSRNFLGVPAAVARANHRAMNATLRRVAERRQARVADLHAHFLRGQPDWFTHTIEPSLVGASEVRRAFLQAL